MEEIVSLAYDYIDSNLDDLRAMADSIEIKPGENIRETVLQTPEYEVVLVKWKGVSRSPMHIHQRKDEKGTATSFVFLISGSLLEERKIGDKISLVVIRQPLSNVVIPASEAHQVTSLEDSLTVNVYIPPAYNKAI